MTSSSGSIWVSQIHFTSLPVLVVVTTWAQQKLLQHTQCRPQSTEYEPDDAVYDAADVWIFCT